MIGDEDISPVFTHEQISALKDGATIEAFLPEGFEFLATSMPLAFDSMGNAVMPESIFFGELF